MVLLSNSIMAQSRRDTALPCPGLATPTTTKNGFANNIVCGSDAADSKILWKKSEQSAISDI